MTLRLHHPPEPHSSWGPLSKPSTEEPLPELGIPTGVSTHRLRSFRLCWDRAQLGEGAINKLTQIPVREHLGSGSSQSLARAQGTTQGVPFAPTPPKPRCSFIWFLNTGRWIHVSTMSGYIDNIANDTLLMSGYKYNIWLEGSTRSQLWLRACFSGLSTSVPQLKGRSYSSTGAVAEITFLYLPYS